MKLHFLLAIILFVYSSLATTASAAVPIEQLIEDLASDSFFTREKATRLFLEQDACVIPLVRDLVQTTDDAEVKHRAKWILMVLEKRDFDARLLAIQSDTDEKQGVSLPGWKQFRQVAGKSQSARDLFVEMQRAESKLLQLFDTSPDKVPDAMAQQLVKQMEAANVTNNNHMQQINPGTVVTYWFLAGQPELKISSDLAKDIVKMHHPSLNRQLASQDLVLRSLYRRWILREMEPLVMKEYLNHAAQLNMPEAEILAERVVTSTMEPSARIGGLNMLVKAKKKAALPILEKALSDEGIVCQFVSNGTRGDRPKEVQKIQFRDLALVKMMGLCAQNPEDFGISVPLLTEADFYHIDYQKLASTDQDRETLHKKWRTWWEEHKSEHLPSQGKPAKP